ncbi:DUF4245 domain-containing protein [Nocardioides sp. MAHUQ-72]|uniref:DUF4245 domain-containing protein n=1 Tax=unclassified Nocardioides TaxID=2615069 RepID=UPI00360EDF5E
MSEVPPSGARPESRPESQPAAASSSQPAGQQGAPRPATGGQGTPGRYQRSTNGLVGALLVTLLAIGAFVAFRAINRDTPEIKPTAVDYLSAVQGAQQGGFDVVYPPSLPDGWIADSVHLTPGERPSWGIGMLTDEGRFVGVRQEDSSLDDMLAEYVDEETDEGDPVTLSGTVGREWRTFSDAGGDHAYATEVGRQWVLVYGSAPTDDLRLVAEDLTTAPVR